MQRDKAAVLLCGVLLHHTLLWLCYAPAILLPTWSREKPFSCPSFAEDCFPTASGSAVTASQLLCRAGRMLGSELEAVSAEVIS